MIAETLVHSSYFSLRGGGRSQVTHNLTVHFVKIINNAGSIIVDLLHGEKKFRLWVGQGKFRFENIDITDINTGGWGVGGGGSFFHFMKIIDNAG